MKSALQLQKLYSITLEYASSLNKIHFSTLYKARLFCFIFRSKLRVAKLPRGGEKGALFFNLSHSYIFFIRRINLWVVTVCGSYDFNLCCFKGWNDLDHSVNVPWYEPRDRGMNLIGYVNNRMLFKLAIDPDRWLMMGKDEDLLFHIGETIQ